MWSSSCVKNYGQGNGCLLYCCYVLCILFSMLNMWKQDCKEYFAHSFLILFLMTFLYSLLVHSSILHNPTAPCRQYFKKQNVLYTILLIPISCGPGSASPYILTNFYTLSLLFYTDGRQNVHLKPLSKTWHNSTSQTRATAMETSNLVNVIC
jgi:hypothetical protein